jgi:hypothetical protein
VLERGAGVCGRRVCRRRDQNDAIVVDGDNWLQMRRVFCDGERGELLLHRFVARLFFASRGRRRDVHDLLRRRLHSLNHVFDSFLGGGDSTTDHDGDRRERQLLPLGGGRSDGDSTTDHDGDRRERQLLPLDRGRRNDCARRGARENTTSANEGCGCCHNVIALV